MGDMDLDLDDDSVKLGLKGGDIGGLGGSPKDNDSPLASLAGKSDGKRMDNIDGTITDLKNQLETLSLGSKGMKGDVDKIKTDIETINDSLKNLLCVYEAVSREYNPFVDSELPKPKAEEPEPEPCPEASEPLPDPEVSEPMSSPEVSEPMSIPEMSEPLPAETVKQSRIIELDPNDIDMEVLPEETAPSAESIIDEEPADDVLEEDIDEDNELMDKLLDAKGESVEEPVELEAPPTQKVPAVEKKSEASIAMSLSKCAPADLYSVIQIHKLVEHNLEQIFMMKVKGEDVPDECFEALERWIGEFRKIGVK